MVPEKYVNKNLILHWPGLFHFENFIFCDGEKA